MGTTACRLRINPPVRNLSVGGGPIGNRQPILGHGSAWHRPCPFNSGKGLRLIAQSLIYFVWRHRPVSQLTRVHCPIKDIKPHLMTILGDNTCGCSISKCRGWVSSLIQLIYKISGGSSYLIPHSICAGIHLSSLCRRGYGCCQLG